ncbi:hypothetical protein EJ110_NYTH56999 [Nymphaea thermarum]|nr:hypothetical protein EJ110_NYTH56999 [Nymphaea thermarum]
MPLKFRRPFLLAALVSAAVSRTTVGRPRFRRSSPCRHHPAPPSSVVVLQRRRRRCCPARRHSARCRLAPPFCASPLTPAPPFSLALSRLVFASPSVCRRCSGFFSAVVFFCAVAWECALFVLFVMAAEMGSQKDVVLDAASASKTENVPIQVTSIRLTKDNYLSWSAALEIGITSRGRLPYITGEKPPPLKSDPQWATWALEDSQVWIISSVSADIQPLILRKPTSFDMWNVLAKMYGRKKRHLRTYQIKRSIYSLKQGDLSVAAFYAALKTKWEELDYHVSDEWNCGLDHSLHWEKEWMDHTFLFLGGLQDEFEPIRSQILNGDDIPGIEEVYARVESEEQRRLVMHPDASHGSAPSAFVSRASASRAVQDTAHQEKSLVYKKKSCGPTFARPTISDPFARPTPPFVVRCEVPAPLDAALPLHRPTFPTPSSPLTPQRQLGSLA